MKTVLTFVLALLTVNVFGANPAFESFPTNQFNRNNVTLTYREGKTLFVDSVHGLDSTAHRTNGIPFRTPRAAVTNALAGDLIVVREGVYTNGVTNLFKGGVDWHFQNCELQWTDPTTNGHGHGCFDDRGSGAVTSAITGSLTIRYSTGTNGYFGPGCETYFGNYLNNFGPIVLTNAQTLVRWSAATTIYVYGPTASPFALYVLNCNSNTFFNIDHMYNGSPFAGDSFTVTNCPASPGDPFSIPTSWSAIYWELGTLHVKFKHIGRGGIYSVLGYLNETNQAIADLYLTGDLCESKIYFAGQGDNLTWKSWVTIGQLFTYSSSAYDVFGSGTHYITAQKIGSDNGAAISMAGNGGYSNQVVHITAQKVSSNLRWLESNAGVIRGQIDEFEDTGTNMSSGIQCRLGATIELQGVQATASRRAVLHEGGNMMLGDYRIVCTNTDPILVSGSGFIAKDLTLVTGATNCIRSDSAQTVKLYGHNTANTNEHPNVTISTGTLTVNGVVQ